MPKHKRWFWLTALAAGWLVDFLFWSKTPGVSFLIWIAVLLAVGYLLAWREGKKPARLSLVLTALVLFFASVLAWRNEPFTRVVSLLLTLAGSLLISATFLNGLWPFYRIRDYVTELFHSIFGGGSGAIRMVAQNKNTAPDGSEKPSTARRLLPVLRGVLIALPIVVVLGLLLASADPVFGDALKKIFDLEKIPEYLFRLIYIVVIAMFLVGIYLHAIHPAKEAAKMDPNQPWLKPFLGWMETGIVLGAVNLLFIVFIIIQVRYLFGGSANISETGYTYSEYARRGFGELVAVAVISLLLYLGLSTIGKGDTRISRIGFKVLSVLLMVNVLVILASSLQRLLLYEDAYGFSQLRTYTHVFIFWLAGLIVTAILLELFHRRGHFALALLVAVVGFGASLAFLNVDSFITNRNVERAVRGEELDLAYLNTLTADAVPILVEKYADPSTPGQVKELLGNALACREKTTNDPATQAWQSYNFGESAAYKLLTRHSDSWSQYVPTMNDNGAWVIEYQGEMLTCDGYLWMD